VSYDLWTSPNGLPILVIIFHYVGKDKKVHCIIAALREVSSNYTGENLAVPVIELIKD